MTKSHAKVTDSPPEVAVHGDPVSQDDVQFLTDSVIIPYETIE
eukprot:CAMPEP_0176341104 /NCGR_PEP_ID=MMETSP0126-20121128/2100_1 /TAXON_ID=141414 ORGANISM="Strombidinopsis acuminatum, Strain SPMC142" /NCGR_SAMPLE_ID=MMETSP0126 /ASSEMBLY_ACC=CAM_ASM_000229 /LENGTH=42 /DNA_ID= /DNA_START= /DNA_END= /DNA_ORIENTATION=